MIPTPRRHAVILLATVALLAGACTAAPPGGPAAPPSAPPVRTPTAVVETDRPSRPTLPPTGNTEHEFPQLAVSGGPGFQVELSDPTAKAWRIVVAGTNPGDRLELLVEVGDVWPGVVVTTVVNGAVVDEHDLTGMLGQATAAAGGCHPALEVCYSSDGILVDLETGTIGLVVEHLGGGPFTVVGGSAGWPGDPFVLGPWRTTAPFTTGS